LKIYSNNIINGYFDDKIGHRGTQFLKNKPNYSFHLGWSDLPKGTKSLALVFDDPDAIPVCGFSWIHWAVANIDPKLDELPENASEDMDLLEGVNSWVSGLLPESIKLSKEEATGFGGCAPPDKTHRYTIDVYALDKMLNLSRGFYLNEMLNAMEGHVLDHAKISALYKPK
jgi:Raf kinase inhibitor-like YbhB/YbcL family protein